MKILIACIRPVRLAGFPVTKGRGKGQDMGKDIAHDFGELLPAATSPVRLIARSDRWSGFRPGRCKLCFRAPSPASPEEEGRHAGKKNQNPGLASQNSVKVSLLLRRTANTDQSGGITITSNSTGSRRQRRFLANHIENHLPCFSRHYT